MRKRIRKMKCRIGRIKGATKNPRHRRTLVRQLVWPTFGFAGGLVTIPKAEVKELRKQATQAILGWMPRDATPYMLSAVALEPQDGPGWSLIRGAMGLMEWISAKGTALGKWDSRLMAKVADADIKKWAPGVREYTNRADWT